MSSACTHFNWRHRASCLWCAVVCSASSGPRVRHGDRRLRPLPGFGFDLVDVLGPQATAARNKSWDTSTCGRWPQRLGRSRPEQQGPRTLLLPAGEGLLGREEEGDTEHSWPGVARPSSCRGQRSMSAARCLDIGSRRASPVSMPGYQRIDSRQTRRIDGSQQDISAGCRASSVVDRGSSVACSRYAAMEMGAELDPLDACARCTHRLKRQHGRGSSGVPAPRAARSVPGLSR